MSELTDLWILFTWSVFRWANSPNIFIPACLSIVLLTLLTKSPAWMKVLGRLMAVLLVGYLFMATPFGAFVLTKGLTAFLPQDDNAEANAVVVLSRDDALSNVRYDMAVQLGQSGRVANIFVTNNDSVEYVASLLRASGPPQATIAGTNCSRTTYEEAVSTAAILRPQGIEKIILITDPPHLLRSTLTFQGAGFQVTPKVAPFPPGFPALKKSLLALREYLGLVNYAALGRFRSSATQQGDRSLSSQLSHSSCALKWLTDTPTM